MQRVCDYCKHRLVSSKPEALPDPGDKSPACALVIPPGAENQAARAGSTMQILILIDRTA